MKIKRVKIKGFRTFLDFEIDLKESLEIIVGANNSGKSNFLRALDLFFNWKIEDKDFSRSIDAPYHIAYGSGSSSNTSIEVDLFLEKSEIDKFKDLDKKMSNENILTLKNEYTKDWKIKKSYIDTDWNTNDIDQSINKLLGRIKFMYIPTQIDLTKTINNLVSEEIFPSMIDWYWNTWLAKSIKELNTKIWEIDKLTEEILKQKNQLLTEQYQDTLKSFNEITAWIELEKFSLEVSLNKDDSLSSVLWSRIQLLIKDAAHNTIESKWSWIQKLVLIALLQYFSKNNDIKARYTNPFLIWGIDEPETYMQPKLQKEVKRILNEISTINQTIITTHSPKMIDIYRINNIKLFYITSELKDYKRQHWRSVYKKETKLYDKTSDNFVNKLKEHLWVESNDWWLLKDKNILFEWSDDPNYFYSTYKAIMKTEIFTWTVICNSSTNMPSYVEFLNQQICNKELAAESILCLLDDDNAWREARKKIKDKKYLKTFLTPSLYLSEKDNKSDRYPKMIEDLVIPEVFFESILHFLEKNKKIGKNELEQYKFEIFCGERKKSPKSSMMDFLDNYFDSVIKTLWTFSFTCLDVKFALSTIYCDILWKKSEEEINEYIKKYPLLVDFLKNFD